MTKTEIPVTARELLCVATGRPITVRTLDGEGVLLRLATPDELLRFNREGRAEMEQLLREPVTTPPMTREMAETLCTPLDMDTLR